MIKYLPSTVAAILLAACHVHAEAPAADAALKRRVDAAIAKVHRRELRPDKDTPWVIMHAVIAYEKDLEVTDAATGKRVNAIEFLLNHAQDEGKPMYRMQGGVPRLRTRDITPGFKESFIVQDHVDQFLMAYADAGVALDTSGVADTGEKFTVGTLLDAAKREFEADQELGWTLVSVTTYLPIDATWTTAKGDEMSAADIVALAVKRDARRETEGGPHHLYGIAYALQRYTAAHPDAALEGPWKAAHDYLDRHVAMVRQFQNDDGTFSVAMFRGKRQADSPKLMVWATGHTLEWLCRTLTPEQLREPWVVRAVDRLATTLNDTPTDTLSMGGLYHAAHALRLYHEAVYGAALSN
ncbi:MAG: hypothetical protein GC159_24075 [Phycisphaera sp.]|nr:hypothetical protein [Phycisphaera sp.]